MERTVTLARREMTVTVRELTVADVRQWLEDMQDISQMNVVNAVLFEEDGASLDDVLRMTDLDAGEVEQLTPREVAEVIAKCKKVNPHFFRFRTAMVEIGNQPASMPSEPSSKPTAKT